MLQWFPKKTIGKNIIVDALPQNLDLLRTIEYVLGDGARQYTEHSGNVYFETISPTDLNISIIPNASDYIKETKYHRETKEHLTNYDNNLAILENACKNKDCSIIIPTKSFRDEGISYHYLPESEYIELDDKYKDMFKNILAKYSFDYI